MLEIMLPYVSGDVKITSPFGKRVHPITGQTSNHNGIDLVGMTDKRVRSVKSGIVVQSRMVTDYTDLTAEWGNYVAIWSPEDGRTRYYCHLASRFVENGKEVEKGDHIGIEGATGRNFEGNSSVTGAHLHYEVRGISYAGRAEIINAADDLGVDNCIGVYKQTDYSELVKERCGLTEQTIEKLRAAAVPYEADLFRKLYAQML